MNVLIISQCNKSALIETRRIVDQFAERKGDRAWQTAITAQGLAMLRKLLRKTARRNTAVACHWMKNGNRSELLWIVGNISQFNENGIVPTNITSRDILRSTDENQWHTLEDIAILSGIAGLFHDFGKANVMFQAKLKKSGTISEPYRHEWVSLRLFEAFVANLSDEQWLTRLSKASAQDDKNIFANIIKDSPLNTQTNNPFATMSDLAKVIGWLIVSHHRLPKFPKDKENAPKTNGLDISCMIGKRFDASWNSIQCNNGNWTAKQLTDVWKFEQGTPLLSEKWRAKAHKLAQRALNRPALIKRNWFEDRISLHLSRMVLMLADHCYSSLPSTLTQQDPRYAAYANTDRKTKKLNQKLDEHNVCVGHNAVLLAKILPKIRHTLPAITRHKGFKKRSRSEKFRWQDKAYDLACGIRLNSAKHGFFGINMASTGCGKTFANGRIMYGLADEKIGCRFSVALGLRTLTLQTGDALRDRLKLADDDLAVLIGSQAVQQLHEFKDNSLEECGSESAEGFFTEEQYVRYDGSLDDGRLSKWLKETPKLHRLLSAPILVSTIDHLIPATEGERGGKQIAPMLRLLTSDLVLDEPDDFDLNDLPALTRLVNWAGLLGSRVLLSSATLPPTLIRALFEAYTSGRRQYQHSVGEINLPVNICCAWFDEHNVEQSNHADSQSFMLAHTTFVDKRIQKLNVEVPLRIAKLLPMNIASKIPVDIVKVIAQQIHDGIIQLHNAHHQTNNINGKKISVGLVRMANIKPLVAVAMQLLATSPPENYCFHFCIYHSQYPLAVRSSMEKQLDEVLDRHDPDKLWQRDTIKQSLLNHSEKNHVYVVLATSVAEVGRDHDYDWAIAEPSSMRSLIQLAGRIQRHRQQAPKDHNLLVLSKNYRALKCENVAYTKPGFERQEVKLNAHDLNEILSIEQLQQINSIPRIKQRAQLEPSKNLVDLEHHALEFKLFGPKDFHASLWWLKQIDWSAELQRHTRFRQQAVPDDTFVLFLDDVDDEAIFKEIDEKGDCKTADYRFVVVELTPAPRANFWFKNNFNEIILECATRLEIDVTSASKKFGEISLRQTGAKWLYHPMLGVFQALD